MRTSSFSQKDRLKDNSFFNASWPALFDVGYINSSTNQFVAGPNRMVHKVVGTDDVTLDEDEARAYGWGELQCNELMRYDHIVKECVSCGSETFNPRNDGVDECIRCPSGMYLVVTAHFYPECRPCSSIGLSPGSVDGAYQACMRIACACVCVRAKRTRVYLTAKQQNPGKTKTLNDKQTHNTVGTCEHPFDISLFLSIFLPITSTLVVLAISICVYHRFQLLKRESDDAIKRSEHEKMFTAFVFHELRYALFFSFFLFVLVGELFFR